MKVKIPNYKEQATNKSQITISSLKSQGTNTDCQIIFPNNNIQTLNKYQITEYKYQLSIKSKYAITKQIQIINIQSTNLFL